MESPSPKQVGRAATGDMAVDSDIDDRALVKMLRKEIGVLKESQHQMQVEMHNIRNDQLDQYMYARKVLNFTLRLSTQVERIMEREDTYSRSLEGLQSIGRDILKALETYHAPGSNDPLRFLKQKTMQSVMYKQEQVLNSGSPTGDATRSAAEPYGKDAATGNISAQDLSAKPDLKENRKEMKSEMPNKSAEKTFKFRLDTPVFVPSSSTGSEYIPQATSQAFSVPNSGGWSSFGLSAPISGNLRPAPKQIGSENTDYKSAADMSSSGEIRQNGHYVWKSSPHDLLVDKSQRDFTEISDSQGKDKGVSSESQSKGKGVASESQGKDKGVSSEPQSKDKGVSSESHSKDKGVSSGSDFVASTSYNGAIEQKKSEDDHKKSFILQDQVDQMIHSRENTLPSNKESSQQAVGLQQTGSDLEAEKLEEVWGPLIPVAESERDERRELGTGVDESSLTYDFFATLNENDNLLNEITNLPNETINLPNEVNHEMESRNQSNLSESAVPLDIDAETASLHARNLTAIREFTLRAEERRRAGASITKADEATEGEKPLPWLFTRPYTAPIPTFTRELGSALDATCKALVLKPSGGNVPALAWWADQWHQVTNQEGNTVWVLRMVK